METKAFIGKGWVSGEELSEFSKPTLEDQSENAEGIRASDYSMIMLQKENN